MIIRILLTVLNIVQKETLLSDFFFQKNTDINNQPVNLNNGDNNNPCCSGCCQTH